MNSTKISNFLNEQIAQADAKAKAYLYDNTQRKLPERNIFYKLQHYLDDFLSGETNNRWLTLTGLRGAGKTTLLLQILYNNKEENAHRLFLSLDQTSQILNVSLDDIISTYEELIGCTIENLDKPLLLFLDEVQYDQKWAITLKTLFDRSHKVFIFATGSAALLLNLNPDITRRSVFEKLFPLSFPEYLRIKQHRPIAANLESQVKQIIFTSTNAKEAYQNLYELTPKINKYYLGISRLEFEAYLAYGSLPFMLSSNNETIIYDQISKTLDRVINSDIASTGRFSSNIISRIPAILYAVADMDAFNFSTLAQNFAISRPKIMEIFDLLEKTEILHRIYPHGSHLKQSNKPSKYLFSAPAFRNSYYKMIGNIITQNNARGKLLEDLISMYLHQILHKSPPYSLTYDATEGGADFILGLGNRNIVIEVGSKKKDFKQVTKTSAKVGSSYNLIISSEELALNETFNTLKIPFKSFLLAE